MQHALNVFPWTRREVHILRCQAKVVAIRICSDVGILISIAAGWIGLLEAPSNCVTQGKERCI